jgi:hypothetical protein
MEQIQIFEEKNDFIKVSKHKKDILELSQSKDFTFDEYFKENPLSEKIIKERKKKLSSYLKSIHQIELENNSTNKNFNKFLVSLNKNLLISGKETKEKKIPSEEKSFIRNKLLYPLQFKPLTFRVSENCR